MNDNPHLLRYRVQGVAIEGRNHPTDMSISYSLFKSRDFATTYSRLATFELYQPDIDHVSFARTQAKSYGIDYAGTWCASLSLEESNTPASLFELGFQCRFTSGLRRVRLDEGRVDTPCLPGLPPSFAPISHSGNIVPQGQL